MYFSEIITFYDCKEVDNNNKNQEVQDEEKEHEEKQKVKEIIHD